MKAPKIPTRTEYFLGSRENPFGVVYDPALAANAILAGDAFALLRELKAKLDSGESVEVFSKRITDLLARLALARKGLGLPEEPVPKSKSVRNVSPLKT